MFDKFICTNNDDSTHSSGNSFKILSFVSFISKSFEYFLTLSCVISLLVISLPNPNAIAAYKHCADSVNVVASAPPPEPLLPLSLYLSYSLHKSIVDLL